MRHTLALLALIAGTAAAQIPTLTLESLPRPTTPPPESGPVMPSQVQRWRDEGQAYEYGEGVPRDPVRAAQLYCRAARYGDSQAQYNLGWMLTMRAASSATTRRLRTCSPRPPSRATRRRRTCWPRWARREARRRHACIRPKPMRRR